MTRYGTALLGAVVLAAGCVGRPLAPEIPDPAGTRDGAPVPVVVSFYPLYEFTMRIGGDAVAVRNLVPAGAAPHDFEPSARDVVAITAGRLLVFNGAGFEPWIEKLLPTLPVGVERVNTTAGLPLVTGKDEQEHEQRARGRDEPRGTRMVLDPHVWIDPVLARHQVERILAGLSKVDPDRRSTYEAGAAALRADLQALHERYGKTLSACRKRVFVTSHAAFGYLARRYGLTMIAVGGLSPESEPTLARLRDVLREVKRHGVRVIYFETLTSPKVAQTIAREVGARTLVLNPVEGLTPAQQAAGATYFTVMYDNLRNLTEGLDCR